MRPLYSFLLCAAFLVIFTQHSVASNTAKPTRTFVDSVRQSASFYVHKDCDPLLWAQHTSISAQSSALGFSGLALTNELSTAFLNPSLLFSQRSDKSPIVFGISYGRDSLFQDYITGGGIRGKLSPNLCMGLQYRYMRESDLFNHQDLNLSLAGRLFGESFNQGPVDLGINVRWEKMKFTKSVNGSYVVQGRIGGSSHNMEISSVEVGPKEQVTYTEDRIILDLGLFQRKIAEYLDFGIVFHNLAGYRMSANKPVIKHKRLYLPVDTLAGNENQNLDTTGYIDSLDVESEEISEWTEGYYRRMSAGVVFHKPLIQRKILIRIPIDVEFLGLLDRSIKTHTVLRTGAELWIRENYCLRFGYARAPHTYSLNFDGMKNFNLFSGGAGIRFDKVSLDFYIKGSQEWGVAANLGL